MTEEIYDRNKPGLVRSLALGVATAGALGSLAFTLQAGGHNVSVILMLLFSVWVLSPFILLIIFCMRSGSWSSRCTHFTICDHDDDLSHLTFILRRAAILFRSKACLCLSGDSADFLDNQSDSVYVSETIKNNNYTHGYIILFGRIRL